MLPKNKYGINPQPVLNKNYHTNIKRGLRTMPYTTNILNPNQEIYNYIEDVNYGMSKPQLDHLSNLMYGLIVVDGNKSINSVSKTVLSAKDSSCIYKFLSKSEWDDT